MNWIQAIWGWLIKVAILIATYFAPVKEVFIVMVIFVALDLVTGIWASNKRQVPRSSRRARKSIFKLCGYLSVILLSYMIEQLMAFDWFVAHRFVAAFICTIELLSILENLTVITEHPVFLKILKLVRGKISTDGVINDIINEKNDTFQTADGGTVSDSPDTGGGLQGDKNG